jgi:uncharacterized membrane protein YfcA
MPTASLADPEIWTIAACAAVMGAGGFVKGAVGFAMPMVALSGLGLFLTAQDAIALMVLPSAISNLWQMFRQGRAAARETFARFWKLNLAMAVMLALSAQLVPRIDSDTLFVIVGVTVSAAALVQLVGLGPAAREDAPRRGLLETAIGLFAGAIGGVTGVWGPPVLFYLIALGTEKRTQVRMLGINFGIGWAVLTLAHLKSGVLNAATIPVSAAMLLPVLAGMALGMGLQDRMDAARFRRITLVVLCAAGLNLLRRGLV